MQGTVPGHTVVDGLPPWFEKLVGTVPGHKSVDGLPPTLCTTNAKEKRRRGGACKSEYWRRKQGERAMEPYLRNDGKGDDNYKHKDSQYLLKDGQRRRQRLQPHIPGRRL